MTLPEVMDDVWLEIFNHLPPSTLNSLAHVCSHFRELVTKPLLRHILWSTSAQCFLDIVSWKSTKYSLTMLPRSVTINLPFNYDSTTRVTTATPAYDAIFQQLPLFTSLHSLILTGTFFGTDIFATLAGIPTLRTLVISDCIYHPKPLAGDSLPNFTDLPLRHLKLHGITLPSNYSQNSPHPIHLITAHSLTSLDITWTDAIAAAYGRFIHPPWSGNPNQGQMLPMQNLNGVSPQPKFNPVPAPRLQFLEVQIPLLTRALLHGLAHLTYPRTLDAGGAETLPSRVRSPRLTVSVRHWSIDEQHLRELDQREAVRGLWSYSGPMEVLGVFIRLGKANMADMAAISATGDNDGLDASDATDEDGEGYALRHLQLVPPASDLHVLEQLLWVVHTKVDDVTQKPTKRLKQLFTLEVCLLQWDMEILFAIRSIFKNIQSVVIRTGQETWDEVSMPLHSTFPFNSLQNILLTLGGSILPSLPRLHTLRIIHDRYSVNAAHPLGNILSGHIQNSSLQFSLSDRTAAADAKVLASEPLSFTLQERKEQTMTVRDYLYGWTRYCTKLRRVRLSKGTEWVRRWEGDEWAPLQASC